MPPPETVVRLRVRDALVVHVSGVGLQAKTVPRLGQRIEELLVGNFNTLQLGAVTGDRSVDRHRPRHTIVGELADVVAVLHVVVELLVEQCRGDRAGAREVPLVGEVQLISRGRLEGGLPALAVYCGVYVSSIAGAVRSGVNYRAIAASRLGSADADVVLVQTHVRARKSARHGEAEELLVSETEAHVQARQHVVVAGAARLRGRRRVHERDVVRRSDVDRRNRLSGRRRSSE